MAFTEFYIIAGGSNLNAGSTTGGAVYSGVGDSDGTNVFTPSDGSTPANTVSAGMFASVYVTSGATVATFVGRVTNVAAGVNGAITVSTTAKSGTFPSSSAGAHTISCKVGGAWSGPTGSTGFPFNFVTAAMTDATPNTVRVNLNHAATPDNTISASVTAGTSGPIVWQGYTTNPGDGGRWILDGGTSGTGYALIVSSGGSNHFVDIEARNNGNSGTLNTMCGFQCTNVTYLTRCVVHDVRGNAYTCTGATYCHECEAYNHNLAAQSLVAAFHITGQGCHAERCIAHDSQSTGSVGFRVDQNVDIAHCIALNMKSHGLHSVATGTTRVTNCDFYGNTGNGINCATATATLAIFVENCNFVKNTGVGIAVTALQTMGVIRNCGFGSGTQANGGGNVTANITGLIESNTHSVTYASGATPWNAPTTGDFSIVSSSARYAGTGAFLETGNTYSGTIAYPDIGAANHAPTPELSVIQSGQDRGDGQAGTFMPSNMIGS